MWFFWLFKPWMANIAGALSAIALGVYRFPLIFRPGAYQMETSSTLALQKSEFTQAPIKLPPIIKATASQSTIQRFCILILLLRFYRIIFVSIESIVQRFCLFNDDLFKHHSLRVEVSLRNKKIEEAGDILGIPIIDHLVFSEEGFISMLEGSMF
ncbi:MAG TPA: hypothetical protein PLU12_01495 [Sphaerochaeta sp.]|nr:hypothetical protein [Sphaerochaeta sp.]